MAIISGNPTNGNDIIVADDANDQINSLAGNDTVSGGGGNDTLNGGNGNDLIAGNKGIDTMIGGAGNDILIWADGEASDRISGNAGDDIVGVQGSLAQKDSFVLGQQGNLAIFDRIDQGREFKLTVDTSEQFIVQSEGGNDSFVVNNLANTDVELVTFSGGAGNDTLDGTNTSTHLVGNGDAGNDLLIGGSVGDILNGGEGNDFIAGAKGVDTITGGAGNDIIDWFDGDASDQISGDAGNDTVGVQGSLALEDTFVLGQQGNLAIFDRTDQGRQFKLTVDTSETFAVLGEGGNDSFDVNNLANTDVELVTFSGGAGNDTLDGTDTSTQLVGNGDAGNDLLVGSSVADILNGGEGNDIIVGNKGIDTMTGGAGNDIIDWFDGDASDQISGDAGNDTVGVQGSLALEDTFILGQQGNLAIFDRIDQGRQFKLTVDTSETFAVLGEGGNDSFDVNNLANTDVELVTFSGGAGNDTLDGTNTSTHLVGNGDAGNDVLIGGSASDILTGGAGSDTLTGGAGDDYFTFNAPNQGVDRITDFAIADDSIQVLATGFGGGLTAGALGAGQFRIGAAAADANDRFIYNDVNGNLSFDGDGVGGAAQVQFATLIGAPTLNAGGIVVI